ncbi:LPS biosynthesis protein RfbU [Bacteroidota bacterium]|nr:LPS biosynthesis protein RfbU [Bacteroidota bacterium]
MKILFLTCWYPHKENPGKGIFIKEHANAIKSVGNEIVVIAISSIKDSALYKKTVNYFTDENGVETISIELRSRFNKLIYANPLFLYYHLKIEFRKFKPKNKFDVIHANIIAPCGLMGYWLSKATGIPLIITEHWSKVGKFMKKNIFSSVAQSAFRHAKFVTTVSEFLKNNISEFVIGKEKIKVIPNMVDSEIFCYQPKQKHNELIFTAVATWEPPKLPMLFVNALNEIQKTNLKKIVLNLIGDGSQLNEIKQNQNLIQINYYGRKSKPEIATMLHQSDFFIHASSIETFSVVIAEALCTGTPVIASNAGAIPELINEENGLICQNGNAEWITGINNAREREFNNEKIASDFSATVNEIEIGKKFTTLYSYASLINLG